MSDEIDEKCEKVIAEMRTNIITEFRFQLNDVVLPIQNIPAHWRICGHVYWIGEEPPDTKRPEGVLPPSLHELWAVSLEAVVKDRVLNLCSNNLAYLVSYSTWDGYLMSELEITKRHLLSKHIRTLLYRIEKFEKKFPIKEKEK